MVRLDHRYEWNDEYLESKLQEAQKLEEKKVKRSALKQSGNDFAIKMMKYGIYIWAARLGLMGLGGFLPLLGILLSSWLPAREGELTILKVRYNSTLSVEAIRGVYSHPIQIEHVPIPSNNTLIKRLFDRDIKYKKIKVQTDVGVQPWESAFSYLDARSAWADKMHLLNPSYHTSSSTDEIQGFPWSSDEVCMNEAYCSPRTRAKWHITQPLVLNTTNKIAPSLLSVVGLHAENAAYHLWLGRQNATVSPHYDIEDNVYLQMHGDKTFLIASPEAFRFFKPHSVLHPSWRQAQRDYLVTLRQWIQASREVRSGRDFTSANAPPVAIWQVTLLPGDLLYLPAYHFHTVMTGHESVSVNAWIPSSASAAYEEVRRLVPRPFDAHDQEEPVDTKLAALGAMIARVLEDNLVGSSYTAVYLRRLWIDRHLKTGAAQGGAWCMSSSSKQKGNADAAAVGLCSAKSMLAIESKSYRIKISHSIQTLLLLLQPSSERSAEGGIENSAIRLMMAFDWAEEVLHGLLGPESSPCSVMIFINTCLV